MSQNETKRRWTTVRIPTELRDYIRNLAMRENKTEWQIIMDSVSFYYAQKQKPRVKEEASILDKVSWYITKLATSVGAFKENPSEDNLLRLRKTAEQVKERLGVDTSLLVRVAEAYMNYRDEDSRMELNAALKMVILEIILNKLAREQDQPSQT